MFKNENSNSYEFFENLFFEKLEEVHTSQPCKVINIDVQKNRVDVELDKEKIILKDVQIKVIGSISNYVSIPIKEGDRGLLIFSKHDLMEWTEAHEAEDALNNFSISNAFFSHGISSQALTLELSEDVLKIVSDKKTEIISEDILLKAKTIQLNNGTDELFALLAQTCIELSALSQILSTHTGLSATIPYVGKFSALSSKFQKFK